MSILEVDSHNRTIIHIDIDCFYAQVETNKKPELLNVPLGIQQKNIVVTSNYKAREYGITKCMPLSDAKKACPNLVLVNGEDLHDYRQISYKVTNLLQKYSLNVERLGLDENFIDVTNLVNEKLKEQPKIEIIGNVFGDLNEKCDCGCYERITIGTHISKEIRDLLKEEFNLTTCAGVAHNKLLAKIAGSRHKPNQQTALFPNNALGLILSLKTVTSIPGIGNVTGEQLGTIGITTIEDAQNASIHKIEALLGVEKTKTIYNWCFGIDNSLVKNTGKPLSIGLEDSCRTISVEKEVYDKLHQLLVRLLVLVKEDGRIPKTIKLTVRKVDKATKVNHRETRQCNINPSLFTGANQPQNETKIMSTIMHLFNRIIDPKKSYHVTLFGISFTKFQEAPNSKSSIATFFRKNLEVQSVISIENDESASGGSRSNTSSPIPSTSRLQLEDSPTPSPKKLKLTSTHWTKKRSFNEFFDDCESPSKLRVADLCLEAIPCPPEADQGVFQELPETVQKELWDDYCRKRTSERGLCGSQMKKSKPNTLLNYFIQNN